MPDLAEGVTAVVCLRAAVEAADSLAAGDGVDAQHSLAQNLGRHVQQRCRIAQRRGGVGLDGGRLLALKVHIAQMDASRENAEELVLFLARVSGSETREESR